MTDSRNSSGAYFTGTAEMFNLLEMIQNARDAFDEYVKKEFDKNYTPTRDVGYFFKKIVSVDYDASLESYRNYYRYDISPYYTFIPALRELECTVNAVLNSCMSSDKQKVFVSSRDLFILMEKPDDWSKYRSGY